MFRLYVILILLMFAVGIVLRCWRRTLPAVALRKVSPQAAGRLVAEFLASCYDGQFGFPSGLFIVELGEGNQIVAREAVGRASHFTDILRRLYRSVFGFAAVFGLFGFVAALVVATFLTPVLLYAAFTEVALRYLLRSEIDAQISQQGDGSAVAFRLRGPAALLVGRRIQRAFHTPTLPVRVATGAGIAAPQPAAA